MGPPFHSHLLDGPFASLFVTAVCAGRAPARPAAPVAQASAVRVVVPGSGIVASSTGGGAFSYPVDGAVVSTAATAVSTATGSSSTADGWHPGGLPPRP